LAGIENVDNNFPEKQGKEMLSAIVFIIKAIAPKNHERKFKYSLL